jgi:hypothetical protein
MRRRASASPTRAFNAPSREQQTPGVLARVPEVRSDKWWPLIKAANIKVAVTVRRLVLAAIALVIGLSVASARDTQPGHHPDRAVSCGWAD